MDHEDKKASLLKNKVIGICLLLGPTSVMALALTSYGLIERHLPRSWAVEIMDNLIVIIFLSIIPGIIGGIIYLKKAKERVIFYIITLVVIIVLTLVIYTGIALQSFSPGQFMFAVIYRFIA